MLNDTPNFHYTLLLAHQPDRKVSCDGGSGGFLRLVVGTRPQLARLEVLLAVPIKDDDEDSTTCSTSSCSS